MEEERQEGKGSNELLNFWFNQLTDLPEARLPSDYPRSSTLKQQQRMEEEVSLSLSEETCVSVLKMSLMQDVKPFTILLAAFACLLRKFTYEEDLVIGSSSRSSNPLIFRLDVSGNIEEEGGKERQKTLKEIVQQTKEAEVRAEEHEIDFNVLVEGLRHVQGLDDDALSSLFQVRFFNSFDVLESTIDSARCDWNVFLEMESDCKRLLPLRVRIIYNAVLFSRIRMEEILQQINSVAFQMSSNPSLTYGDLDVRTKDAVSVLPDPRADLDARFFGSAYSHFHQQAIKDPEALCVVETDRSYNYKEIDEASNRVAHYLLDNKIEKEDIVALYAHRSSAMVVAVMGILKAGATLTVVDPAYPPPRQNIYLSVAKPRAILTIKAAGLLSGEVEKYIAEELELKCRLDNLTTAANEGPLSSISSDYPGVEVNGDNIATLSFTSGSTGIPKGVRGRHISLTHFYPWMSEEFGIGKKDRFTMLSGIAHDPIQRDIFTPLFFGASLYVPLAIDIGTPGRLAEWMRETKCSVTHLTPAMGQLLTANAFAEMPDLHLSFFVGDVLTKVDVMRLQSLAKNVTVVNMYGTTETQRAVSFYKIAPKDQAIRDLKDILPAGVGMKDAQLIILSNQGKECGIGELGEIFVHSYHLARGYLGLPEATNEKFIQNPFSEDPGNRFYRTGDLGRYLPNGAVECIGRADDQVKIRGFRIELREIDTYLAQHPHVRECVTMVRRDAKEEKILVSYFVPKSEEFSIPDIRGFLKTKLPVYSIPALFFRLLKMPLTPNGKIDKAKLPAPDLAPSHTVASPSLSGLSVMEVKMKKLWESVLGHSIGLEDSFFDCGGHSVMATQLTFQMRKELGIDVPLNLLFTHPTLKEMSPILEKSLVEPWILDDSSASVPPSSSSDSSAPGSLPRYMPNIKDEIRLDPKIASQGRKYVPVKSDDIKGVFVTGGTGFVGCFLIRDLLLTRKNATVYTLVRGKDAETAKNRLRDTMKGYGVFAQVSSVFDSRVEVVLGDLAKPRLGLNQDDWDKLACSVQGVFHSGAIVHWVWPYSKMKAANVLAVEEVFRLASHPSLQTLTPVFFLSSTSVFDSEYYAKLTVSVHEDDPLQAGESLQTGYAQSKYVAEGLCQLAHKRGLPVIIFRPAFIIGDSVTGVCNVDDYLVRMIQGCIELKSAPQIVNSVTCCAVDFVTSAIIHIAAVADKYFGHAFHFCNPDRFRFSSMFKVLEEFGYQIKMEQYIAWRDILLNYTLQRDDHALYPLLHFVLDDLPNKSKNPDFDSSNLQEALRYTTIKCPSSATVVATQVKFLVRHQLVPSPVSPSEKWEQGGEEVKEDGGVVPLKRTSAI